MTAIEAVEAEATAEENVFTLSTALGEADIAVPPMTRWRSSARHALIAQGDDFTWARSTLSREDFAEWQRCDPDAEESARFFADVMAHNGADLPKSGGSKASSRSTRKQ